MAVIPIDLKKAFLEVCYCLLSYYLPKVEEMSFKLTWSEDFNNPLPTMTALCLSTCEQREGERKGKKKAHLNFYAHIDYTVDVEHQ